MLHRGKTYWLVGASEGLGRALAHELSESGVELVLSARSEDRLKELSRELPGPARVLPLDVTDNDNVISAAQELGQIDGIIYMAGAYVPMSCKEWDAGSVEKICDVNFMGAVRVLGQVVPQFVAANKGHIVLIGSLAGYRALPNAVGYSASKAALMHLGENIALDLSDTDVQVQVLNPGFVKTRLTDQNSFKMPFIMSPEKAAKTVARTMQGSRFQTAFPAPFSWLFKALKFIPHQVLRWAF